MPSLAAAASSQAAEEDLHPVPAVETYVYLPFSAGFLVAASYLASAVAFPAVAVLAAAFGR